MKPKGFFAYIPDQHVRKNRNHGNVRFLRPYSWLKSVENWTIYYRNESFPSRYFKYIIRILIPVRIWNLHSWGRIRNLIRRLKSETQTSLIYCGTLLSLENQRLVDLSRPSCMEENMFIRKDIKHFATRRFPLVQRSFNFLIRKWF